MEEEPVPRDVEDEGGLTEIAEANTHLPPLPPPPPLPVTSTFDWSAAAAARRDGNGSSIGQSPSALRPPPAPVVLSQEILPNT